MIGAAQATFPNADKIPRINYTEDLPERQKKVLRELNIMIDESTKGIAHLPYNKFQMERDLIY